MQEMGSPEIKNRQQRRHEWRQAKATLPPPIAKLVQSDIEVQRFEAAKSKSLNQKGQISSLVAMAYKGPAFTSLMSAYRTRSYVLEEASQQGFIDKPSAVVEAKKRDFFGTPTNGVTLKDIEKFPLPLDRTSLIKIATLFRKGIFEKSKFTTEMAREAAYLLPTQSLAQKGISVPKELQPLNDRMQAFYDYCLDYLIDSKLSLQVPPQYIIDITFRHHTLLHDSLTHAPARLGLLPQTIMEALRATSTRDDWGVIKRTVEAKKDLISLLDTACPNDTLPEKVTTETDYDIRAIKPTPKNTKQLYRPESVPTLDDYEESFKQLSRYKPAFKSAILSQPDQILSLQSEHPQISSIDVTSHNNQASKSYSNTLIFIVHMRNGATTCLEVNNFPKIWGIPLEILQQDLHADWAIANELLKPTLEFCRQRFIPEQNILPPIFRRPVISAPIIEPTDTPEIREKVKTRGIPFLNRSPDPDPEPAINPLNQDLPATQVKYTRKSLGPMAGTKDPRYIQRLEKTLTRFEQTGNGHYQLEQSKNKGIELYALKCGHDRILLTRLNSGFELFKIIDRADYNDSTLEKIIANL